MDELHEELRLVLLESVELVSPSLPRLYYYGRREYCERRERLSYACRTWLALSQINVSWCNTVAWWFAARIKNDESWRLLCELDTFPFELCTEMFMACLIRWLILRPAPPVWWEGNPFWVEEPSEPCQADCEPLHDTDIKVIQSFPDEDAFDAVTTALAVAISRSNGRKLKITEEDRVSSPFEFLRATLHQRRGSTLGIMLRDIYFPSESLVCMIARNDLEGFQRHHTPLSESAKDAWEDQAEYGPSGKLAVYFNRPAILEHILRQNCFGLEHQCYWVWNIAAATIRYDRPELLLIVLNNCSPKIDFSEGLSLLDYRHKTPLERNLSLFATDLLYHAFHCNRLDVVRRLIFDDKGCRNSRVIRNATVSAIWEVQCAPESSRVYEAGRIDIGGKSKAFPAHRLPGSIRLAFRELFEICLEFEDATDPITLDELLKACLCCGANVHILTELVKLGADIHERRNIGRFQQPCYPSRRSQRRRLAPLSLPLDDPILEVLNCAETKPVVLLAFDDLKFDWAKLYSAGLDPCHLFQRAWTIFGNDEYPSRRLLVMLLRYTPKDYLYLNPLASLNYPYIRRLGRPDYIMPVSREREENWRTVLNSVATRTREYFECPWIPHESARSLGEGLSSRQWHASAAFYRAADSYPYLPRPAEMVQFWIDATCQYVD